MFRKCDPRVALVAFFGGVVQYAMSRYLFGAPHYSSSDETVADELVALILSGLMRADGGKKKVKKVACAKRS